MACAQLPFYQLFASFAMARPYLNEDNQGNATAR